MVHLIGIVSALLGALFTGAALYVALVEHPARMEAGTEVAAREFAPSYDRARRMQATLAIAAGITGVATWLHGEEITWLVAGLVILALVPFTLIVIGPVNARLLAPDRDPGSAETRRLLEQWGRLHAIRAAVALVGTVIYGYAVLQL